MWSSCEDVLNGIMYLNLLEMWIVYSFEILFFLFIMCNTRNKRREYWLIEFYDIQLYGVYGGYCIYPLFPSICMRNGRECSRSYRVVMINTVPLMYVSTHFMFYSLSSWYLTLINLYTLIPIFNYLIVLLLST